MQAKYTYKLKSRKGEWVSQSDRKQTALLSALRNQGALRRSVIAPRKARVIRQGETEAILFLSLWLALLRNAALEGLPYIMNTA